MTDTAQVPAVQPAQRQRITVYDAQPLYDTGQFEHMARIASMLGSSNLMPEHLQVMVMENGATPPANYSGPLWRDEKATTANAFLIVNQARLFGGMDPFALAQCSYVTRGRLGYEGKLVQAVLERAIGAMRFSYYGTPGSESYGIEVTAWVPNADPPREETIRGTVKDWATRKNQNLNQQWQGEASQHRMLHYRGTREWARLYAPGLTLGLLDEDDLEHMRQDFRGRSARINAMPLQPAIPYNPLKEDPEEAAALTPAPEPAQEARQEAPAVQGTPSAPGTIEAMLASSEPAQAETGKPVTDAGTGVTDEAGKPAARRAPRGTPARASAIALKFSQARSLQEVQALCGTELEPFRTEMERLGVNAVTYLTEMCAARDERLAALSPDNAVVVHPAREETPHDPDTGEVTGQAKGPDQWPGAVEDAEVIEDEGRDWDAWLGRFNDDAQACITMESFDLLVNEVQEGENIPRKVLDAFDAIVEARRTTIARSAGQVVTGSNDPGPADAADALAAQAATQDVKPLTPEEALEVVDGWNMTMRRCKSIEDLERFNVEVITPFMTGPQAQFLDREMVEDAETTFRNRKRILANKAAQ